MCVPCCGMVPPKPKRTKTPNVQSQIKELNFEDLANSALKKGTDLNSKTDTDHSYAMNQGLHQHSQPLSISNLEHDNNDRHSDCNNHTIRERPMGDSNTCLDSSDLIGADSGLVLEKNINVSGDTTVSINSNATKSYQSVATISMISKTRIGDYARIEYSHIDDQESSDSTVQAASSQDKGTNKLSDQPIKTCVPSDDNNNDNHNQDGPQNQSGIISTSLSERPSRVSSPGIESTSISIASQLSNEFLEQSLTNVLDSAQTSPSPMVNYGTIGLPLGPPFINLYDSNENTICGLDMTRKSSPETTGAALTAGDDTMSSSSSKSKSLFNSLRRNTSKHEPSNNGGGPALTGLESSSERKKKSSSLKRLFSSKPKLSDSTNELSVDRRSMETPTPSQKSSTSSRKFKGLKLIKVFSKKSKKTQPVEDNSSTDSDNSKINEK